MGVIKIKKDRIITQIITISMGLEDASRYRSETNK